MLRRIELRDLALVDAIELDLSEGLNVISGETGAGKSIFVDALALLCGARADTGMIRSGAAFALVQGELDAPGFETAARRLAATGRHTARVDGELVTVTELAERVGERVAVFAQHGALELQGPRAQLDQLDRLLPPTAAAALAEHRAAHRRLGEVSRRLAAVRDAQRERARRVDVLSFQLREIDDAAPREGEDVALEAELETLRHAERVVSGASAALAGLNDEEGGAVTAAAAALRELRTASRHAAALAALADDLDAAATGLAAVAAEVESFLAGLDADPGRLDMVQSRLAQLDALKRKYGPTLADVTAFRAAAAAELGSLATLDEDEAALVGEQTELSRRLADLARALTAARSQAGEALTAGVAPLLGRLGMTGARFEVALSAAERHGASGADDVAFLFSANVGEPPQPVTQVASGGELSRLMLALHLVTGAGQPTLVFDQVDAGVGGRAAREVGALLAELGRTRQVLVVTHLAQVAANARAHFQVSKTESGGRTLTTARRLEGAERVAELARMLSGTVTPTSLEHAEELLADATASASGREAASSSGARP